MKSETSKAAGAAALIEIGGLSVSFRLASGPIHAVRNVSLAIAPGEIVALVGESGSGKSTIGQAVMGLLRYEKQASLAGSIGFRSRERGMCDLLRLSDQAMRKLRGNEIAMIFQEPMSSLNPLFTIGSQIIEQIAAHREVTKREARERALDLVNELGFPNPRQILTTYPHQISGGMRQRAMIGMALSCEPALLIADEPTTALDVTIQAQIIDLLKRLQKRTQMAILFITHDLGLVAEIAHRALVMKDGEVVEQAPVIDLFRDPKMPYTQALLAAVPRLGAARRRAQEVPVRAHPSATGRA